MNKSYILIALLIAVQVFQVTAGGRFGLDLNRASAYLNAGDCYVYPGVSSTLSSVTTKYYSLPYGWSQFGDKIVIPNMISQPGNWIVGMSCSDGSNSFNEQIRLTVNGLSVGLAPLSGSGSRTLVIGSNFRSQGVSDDDWRGFVGTLPSARAPSSVRESSYAPSLIPTFPNVQFTRDNGWVNNLIRPTTPSTDFVANIIIGQTPAFTQTSQVSDDERRRALNRQFNANKALNELNTLIGQLQSNVDSTSSSISRLQSDVDRARSASSQCNDKILEFSSTKVTAEASIKQINDQLSTAQSRLSDYNNALSALVEKRNSLVQDRSRIESNRAPNANVLLQLEEKYSSCSSQASSVRNQYSGIVDSIQKNSDQILTLKNSAADAPRQISLVNQQISIADRNIADLEAQLADARSRRARLDDDKSRYASLVDSANSQILRLESDNSGLRSQLSGLQSRVDSQLVQCSSFRTQADTIRTQLSGNQNDYDSIVRQITVQQGLISSKQNEINRLNSDLASLPIRRSPLQSSLTSAQSALDRQYSICSASTNALNTAQSNLQAANLKLDTEKRFLSDAQGKLPSAQSEKQAADDAVNRILSAVPTAPTASPTLRFETSTTFPATTPSGAVATVTVGNFRAPVTVNAVDYLTRNYGQGVRRYWQPYVSVGSPVTIMYPVSQTTWGAISGTSSAGVFLPRSSSPILGSRGGLGSFGCSAASGLMSGYGKITSIQPGYITVLTPSSGSMNLRIGGCSRLESNRPEFVASVYDSVFYSGVQSGNDFNVHSLTCLS